MNEIQPSMFAYHLTAFIIGGVYFFASIYGFNALGGAISPIFTHYQPDANSATSSILINITLAVLGSLLPAVVAIIIIHFTLHPHSKLFIFTLSASYLMLHIWTILYNYFIENSFLGSSYLHNLSGKAIGGLMIIWVVCAVYMRSKPNRSVNTDGAQSR